MDCRCFRGEGGRRKKFRDGRGRKRVLRHKKWLGNVTQYRERGRKSALHPGLPGKVRTSQGKVVLEGGHKVFINHVAGHLQAFAKKGKEVQVRVRAKGSFVGHMGRKKVVEEMKEGKG